MVGRSRAQLLKLAAVLCCKGMCMGVPACTSPAAKIHVRAHPNGSIKAHS